MELEEKAEEALETLWVCTEEEDRENLSLDELEDVGEAVISQLIEGNYITRSDGQVSLTDRGRSEGRRVVRRHRLAERLLIDVLHTGDALIEERACKFEHLLDPGLEQDICSLLGHPKVCPHGKAIPPGRCCHDGRRQPQKVVSPLSQMVPGERGRIAYVYAPQSGQLQKLLSMGIVPGTPISLAQRFPSYVFGIHQAQFAVDREIADAIYVRLIQVEPPAKGKPGPRRHRHGIWRRLRHRQPGNL
jgi:DtxR family Mn-dependent transcriptional regulator